jgi:hypothetical protein
MAERKLSKAAERMWFNGVRAAWSAGCTMPSSDVLFNGLGSVYTSPVSRGVDMQSFWFRKDVAINARNIKLDKSVMEVLPFIMGVLHEAGWKYVEFQPYYKGKEKYYGPHMRVGNRWLPDKTHIAVGILEMHVLQFNDLANCLHTAMEVFTGSWEDRPGARLPPPEAFGFCIHF